MTCMQLVMWLVMAVLWFEAIHDLYAACDVACDGCAVV